MKVHCSLERVWKTAISQDQYRLLILDFVLKDYRFVCYAHHVQNVLSLCTRLSDPAYSHPNTDGLRWGWPLTKMSCPHNLMRHSYSSMSDNNNHLNTDFSLYVKHCTRYINKDYSCTVLQPSTDVGHKTSHISLSVTACQLKMSVLFKMHGIHII